LPGIHAASAIYLKNGEEREGGWLMRSENLLPGSQYYNYFISGSLIVFLFTDEQWRLQSFFFSFVLVLYAIGSSA